MKTLIINGSPRKRGETVGLINKLIEQLKGEYKIINAYYTDILPCIDCRYCWSNNGCSINDEMITLHNYLEDCDNVVLASPIYFSQPTGKLLDICSRFQTYFSSKKFRNQSSLLKAKKGAIILVGGGDGNPQKAYETLLCVLKHINVTDTHPLVGSFNTNELTAKKDTVAIKGIESIADFLNR